MGFFAEGDLLDTAGEGLASFLKEEIVSNAVDLDGLVAGGKGLAVTQEVVLVGGLTVYQLLVAAGKGFSVLLEQHVGRAVS